jgi:transposase InsO family protein
LVTLFPSSLMGFVMPWRTSTVIDQKEEFVRLAATGSINFSQLCLRYAISRKTGYKWLARWAAGCGSSRSLLPLSSRPLSSPRLTEASLQCQVLALRTSNPAWGGRKIAHVLMRDQGLRVAPSTVTGILHRHGLISPPASQAATPWQRFEHEAPNRMWQMDFKGHFATDTVRCHALTVLDDHSRFNVLLHALDNERFESVQACLSDAFGRYGLPERINADNGSPCGTAGQLSGVTRLALWLIRLGVTLSYSRPHHPQTNGKDERFHRTLKAEVLAHRHFRDLLEVQHHFDRWRHVYNCQRPHEALHMATPATRYAPSPRPMPDPLPAIEYAPDRIVRKVQARGLITFKGQTIRLSPVLRGLPVALVEHQSDDDVFDVFFCHQRIDRIDLAALR